MLCVWVNLFHCPIRLLTLHLEEIVLIATVTQSLFIYSDSTFPGAFTLLLRAGDTNQEAAPNPKTEQNCRASLWFVRVI